MENIFTQNSEKFLFNEDIELNWQKGKQEIIELLLSFLDFWNSIIKDFNFYNYSFVTPIRSFP